MAQTVGIISLGCAKNQVDGEMLLAALEAGGFTPAEPEEADIVLINTCGFIESAKKESIETILELARLKAEGAIGKLVVTGCLAQRYQEEIHRELPEVDGVFGIGANGDIASCVKEMLEKGFLERFPEKSAMPLCGARRLSTPGFTAYLKIAEGCDNRCTYCAIPLIRGGYRSRPMESIEEEARALVAGGVKELVLIAQDTTRYGLDLYGEYSLSKLLARLCPIEGLRWLRVLYCYPDSITDGLLETMAREEKIVPYMDIPLQHASGKVLSAMNRRGDRESLTALMKRIREKVPGVVLRTTLITGFPGETEEDFEELAGFVKDVGFERLGCFPYSQEEGTPAAGLPGQLEEEVKERRAALITESQLTIMEEKGRALIGKTLTVLTEGFEEESGYWFGRSYMDAPDVDGRVYFTAEEDPLPGDFVEVRIQDCMDGEPVGCSLPKNTGEESHL
ncbi:30S ribosomal protein S12 methylthiotransferase RimO [Oscillospiraceae bacterium 21-37]